MAAKTITKIPLVLYIDDDTDNLKSFKYQFQQYYTVLIAETVELGYNLLKKLNVNVIIADQRMPDMTGTEFFEKISEEFPHTPRLILTGYSDIKAVIDAINRGNVYYYLQKPWKEEEIKMVIDKAIEANILETKNRQLTNDLLQKNKSLNELNEDLKEEISFKNTALEQLKASENLLLESEKKYKRLVESLKEEYLLYSHDLDGVFTYISPSITNVLGYSQNEFLKHYTQYLTDNPINKEAVRRTELSIKGNEQEPYEIEILHKNGETRYLQVREVPIFNEEDNIFAIEGIARDITMQKQLENELHTTQMHYLDFINNTSDIVSYWKAPDGLYIDLPVKEQIDLIYQSVCIDANKPSWESFGLNNKDEIAGKKFIELIKEKTYDDAFALFIKNGYSLQSHEVLLKLPNNHVYFGLDRWHGIVKNNMLSHIWSTSKNITGQKRAEELLKQKENIIDSASSAIAAADLEGKMTYANPVFLKMWGYNNPDEFLGKHFSEYWMVKDKLAVIMDSLWKESTWTGEIKAKRKNGSLFDVQVSASMVYDKKGNPISLMSSSVDISRRLEIEKQLHTTQLHYSDFINTSTDYIGYWKVPEGLRIDLPVEKQIDILEESVCIDANKALWVLYGFSSKEGIIGKKYIELTENHSRNTFKEFVESNYRLIDGEYHAEIKDGPDSYGLENWYGVVEKGMLTHLWSSSRNMTEQKKAEIALKKNEEILNVAQRIGKFGAWDLELDKDTMWWSDGMYEIFGQDKKCFDPNLESILRLYPNPTEQKSKREELIKQLKKTRQETSIEREFYRPDRTKGVYYSTVQPFFDEAGEIVRIIGTAIDITEKKTAENKIRKLNIELEARVEQRTRELEQEKLFANSIIDAIPGVFYAFNKKGEFIRWNQNYLDISGFTDEDMKNIHPLDAIAKKDKQKTAKEIEGTFTKGYSELEAMIIQKGKGETPYFFTAKTKIIGDDNLLIGTGFDMSELHNARQALQESEKKFRDLSDFLPAAIFETDNNGIITYTNKYGKSITEYDSNDIESGISILDIITPEDHKQIKQNIAKIYFGEATKPNEYILISKRGKEVPVLGYTASIVKDDKPAGLRGIFMDITDLKKAQSELRKLSEAIVQSPISVIITDTEGKIEFVNPKFSETTGYSYEEVIGQNPNILSSDIQKEEYYKEMWDTINAGKIWHGEFCNKKKNGDLFWESVSITNIKDEKGMISHFVSVKEDITRQKRILEELKLAKIKADEASRAKSEFLANMSHEIRTPMNSVLGFSELLSNMVDDELQKSYLNSIKSSGKSLLILINDILDLSKIEAGKLDVEYELISLESLFEELETLFSLKLLEKGLEYISEIEPSVPHLIFNDESRLRQLLINLLSNAIKFTEKGYVKIQASAGNQTIENNKQYCNLIICIEDTGIGIPKKSLKKIFEPFTQQEGQSSKKFGGTGLGLTISRKLIDLMDGRIEVESTVGKGSKFSLIFENIEYTTDGLTREESLKLSPNSIEFHGSTVLIVDDIDENRLFLKGILMNYNLKLLEAENGKQAISIINATSPDLIITDLRMPELDGYQLKNYLDRHKELRDIPTLAVSALVLNHNIDKVKEHKFCGFLSKPFHIEELLLELTKYLPYEKIEEEIMSEDKIDTDNLNIKVRDIEKLLAQIGLLDEAHASIKNQQAMDDVKLFSDKCLTIAKENNIEVLKDYGNALKRTVNTLDVELMLDLINNYEKLITKIKKSLI